MAVSGIKLFQLPLAERVIQYGTSRSTATYNTFPTGLERWVDFDQVVQTEVTAGLGSLPENCEFLHGPVCTVRIHSETDAGSKLDANCMSRANKVLEITNPPETPERETPYYYAQHPQCARVPAVIPREGLADAALVYRMGGKTYALVVVEVKQASVVPDDTDFVLKYYPPDSERYVQMAIGQLAGYVLQHGVQYAVITTFSCTWFFKIIQDPVNKTFKMLVSRPIRFDATTITATMGLFALARLAIKSMALSVDGFAPGLRNAVWLQEPTQPSHNIQTRSQSSSSGGGPSAYDTGSGGGRSGGGEGIKTYTTEMLNLGSILGIGGSAVVMSATFNVQPAALKIAVCTSAEMDTAACEASLLRELQTYTALGKLQGSVLPCVLGFGRIDDGRGPPCLFMALERLEGVPLSERQPTKAHGRAAQLALRALHNEGWVHGDLLPGNIMLFEGAAGAAGARLVDLGSSRGGATKKMRQAEESELAWVFARKGVILGPLPPPLKRSSPR